MTLAHRTGVAVLETVGLAGDVATGRAATTRTTSRVVLQLGEHARANLCTLVRTNYNNEEEGHRTEGGHHFLPIDCLEVGKCVVL